METIRVVLDAKLLQAAGQAARQTRQNRSALIREALRNHLRSLEIRASEQRDYPGLCEAAASAGRIARLGSRGGVASEIARGDVRIYQFAPPDQNRPVLVLTRGSAIGYWPSEWPGWGWRG
jgi:hypothetical protein